MWTRGGGTYDIRIGYGSILLYTFIWIYILANLKDEKYNTIVKISAQTVAEHR